MSGKIGVAFITCNREEFLQQSISSFGKDLDEIDCSVIIVNDGDTKLKQKDFLPHYKIINNKKNLGVGKSKNIAFKELQENDYIFIIEDDIIKKPSTTKNVFKEYINYCNFTGIQHFMFGYHGPANKGNISKGSPLPRAEIFYKDNIRILLNKHCVGAFCFYTKHCLDEVGYMDEEYNNAFEHVDHSYMIAKAGMIPGYWWWPDIDKSYELLDEIMCSEVSSTIRPRPEWRENIYKGAEHFYKKHGYRPAWDNYVPDQSESKIKQNLLNIYNKYGVDIETINP